MKDFMNLVKNKMTIPLLYSIIPLTGLSFLFETDSVYGKILLICKFSLMSLLFLLHVYDIPKTQHFIFILLTLVMLISSLYNNNLGVFLLMMILFMAFIVFPQIELSITHKKNLLLLLGTITFCIFIYAMAAPLVQRDFFEYASWFIYCYSPLNANTCGFLIVASFFYISSSMDLITIKRDKWIISLLFVVAVCFVLFLECRTALLILVIFAIAYLLSQRSWLKPVVYYVGLTFAMSFCIIYCLLWTEMNANLQTESIEILGKELFSGREKIWKAAFTGFLQHPLIGNGSEYLTKMTTFSSAHNVLLGILVIMGILPALGYIYFLFRPGYVLNIKEEQNGSLNIPQVCFIASIISTVFECSFTDARLNFLFLPLLLVSGANKKTNMVTKQNALISRMWLRITCTIIIIITSIGFVSIAQEQRDKIYFDKGDTEDYISGDIDYALFSSGVHFDGNMIIYEDTYVPKEGEIPNKFGRVLLQILNHGGKYIETFYAGTELGINTVTYKLPDEMETGIYYIRLKGNTNHKDESVDTMFYLETDKCYTFSFNIKELTEKKVVVTDYSIRKECCE